MTSSPSTSQVWVDVASTLWDMSPLTGVGSDPVEHAHIAGMSFPNNLSSHPQATTLAGDTPSSSSSFSLGGNIEPKLQERICKGLFVPFEIIIASNQGASIDNFLKNLSNAPTSDACSKNSPLLLSLDNWTDAFFIFMAIIISEKPHDAPRLLQYAHLILSMARNNPGPLWAHYDREFCIRKQSGPFPPLEADHPQLYFQHFARFALWPCLDAVNRPLVFSPHQTNYGVSPVDSSFVLKGLLHLFQFA